MRLNCLQSLRTKLVMIILMVLVPLNILVLVLAQRSASNVWKELLASYGHEMRIYMTRMDDEIANVDGAMEELMKEKWLDLNPNSRNYELARYDVWSELQEVRKEQRLVEAAYLRTNWDKWTVVTHDNDRIPIGQKEAIQDYFRDSSLEAYRPMSYGTVVIDGSAFLVANVNYYDYSFGMLVGEESITEGLDSIGSFPGERFFLTDHGGNVISGQPEGGLRIDLDQIRQTLCIGGEGEGISDDPLPFF